MIFSNDQIKPPFAVRQLTALLIQNRLTDWVAVRHAVTGGRETGDDLLNRYEQAWWNDFDGRSDVDSFHQNPHDIVRCWQKQKKNLPAPIPLPPLGLVQLGELSESELERAYSLGCDSLKQLELEIDDNRKFIVEITALLVRCQGVYREMKNAQCDAAKEAQGKVDRV